MRKKPTGNWFRSGLLALAGAPNNYEERKLLRTTKGKLAVDTCWSDDFGWESAVLTKDLVVPCERYKTKKAAIAGHKKWVDFIGEGVEIPYLGTGDGIVKDSVFVL